MADGRVVIDTELNESGVKNGLSKLGSTLGKVGGAALKGTALAIGAVSTAIVGVGVSAVKYNANMEQYATSFEVMTGSAKKAEEVMTKLKKIGAETPFEFEDLAGATQTLMAFGFSADEAIDQFKILGDISQGDAQKLETFSRALGKMESSNKVSLESLNMMIDQGFNPLQVIADKTGESMSDLYDRVSDGKVSVDEIKEAMVTATSEGGQFFGSMDKQSQTLSGKISTLKDNFQQFTGSLFDGASSGAGSVVDIASGWVSEMQTAFDKNGADGLAIAIGGIIGDAIGLAVENLPSLIGIANTIITGLVSSLSDMMYYQSGNLAKLMFVIIDSLGSNAVNFISLGFDIVGYMLQGILENMPNTTSGMSEVITTIVNVITESLPQIIVAGVDIAFQLITSIGNALIENAPLLYSSFQQILTETFKGIGDISPMLKPISDILLFLAENMDTLIPIAITLMSAFMAYEAVTTIVGVITAVSTALNGMTIAQYALNLAMSLNPIGIIIALVVGLIAAIVLLWNNNEGFRDFVISAFETIKDAIKTAIDFIVKLFTVDIPNAINIFIDKVKGLASKIVSLFKGIKDSFVSIGKDIVNGIWEGISGAWSWLTDKFKSLLGKLTSQAPTTTKTSKSANNASSSSYSTPYASANSMSQMQNAMTSTLSSMQLSASLYGATNQIATTSGNVQSAPVSIKLVGDADGLFEVVANKNDSYYNRTGYSRFNRG